MNPAGEGATADAPSPRATEAAVASAAGADFSLRPIELAAPRAGEVVGELEACGIWHADLAARATYRVVLPQDLGPSIQAYISDQLDSGSGAFDPIKREHASVAPEVIDASEGDIETELFGRRVSFNAAQAC